MTSFDVSVQVFQEFDGLVRDEWLVQIVQAVLTEEGQQPGAKVSVAVAGDEVVRTLNKQHRGLDENTDVLSFSFAHQGEYYGEREASPKTDVEPSFVTPPGEEAGLGEVIVSYPQARRQAQQAGHSVDEELATLVAHGVLHLLGHDHGTRGEQAAMNRAQTRALAGVHEGK